MDELVLHAWEVGPEEMATLRGALPPLARLVELPPGPEGLKEILPLGGSILLVGAQDPAGRTRMRRLLLATCAVVLELAYEPVTRLALAADGYRHFVVPARAPGELAAALALGQELVETLTRTEQVALPLSMDALAPPEMDLPPRADSRESAGLFSQFLSLAGEFRLAGDQGELYRRLTESLVGRFPFGRAMLFIHDGQRLRLSSLCWPGGQAAALERALVDEPPGLDPGSPEYEACALGRAFLVPTDDSALWPEEAARLLGPGEVALAPLFSDREFIGLIAADSAREDRGLNEGEMALLETFATLAGAMLQNFWLYSELEEKHQDLELKVRELSMVNEMTRILNLAPTPEEAVNRVLAMVARILNADFAFLFLYNAEGGDLRLLGAEGLDRETIAAWERIRGVPPTDLAPMGRTAAGLRRGLAPADFWLPGLPGPTLVHALTSRGRVVGVWGLGRQSGARPFGAGSEQVFSTADEHVSVALSALRLRHLATTDHLTNLFTRRHFLEALDRELKVARYLEHPLTLIILDVDRFKDVNDSQGHPAGDAVLSGLARGLAASMRGSDFCGRLGGDEFAVILPRCDAKRGYKLAERIRQGAAELVVPYQGRGIRVSVSLGLATAGPGDYCDRDEMVRRADLALYRSKESGRNRTTAWE